MTKVLIAYIAQKEHEILLGNEILWFDGPGVGVDDIAELKECIAMRQGLKSITILNIVKLEEK